MVNTGAYANIFLQAYLPFLFYKIVISGCFITCYILSFFHVTKCSSEAKKSYLHFYRSENQPSQNSDNFCSRSHAGKVSLIIFQSKLYVICFPCLQYSDFFQYYVSQFLLVYLFMCLFTTFLLHSYKLLEDSNQISCSLRTPLNSPGTWQVFGNKHLFNEQSGIIMN